MILAPLSQWMHGYLLKVLHFNTPFKISFLSFPFLNIHQSGNTWPQCTVIFTTLLPFSLLCKSMRVS